MRLALAAAAFVVAATPAAATEWLNCADRESVVTVSLLLGAMDVLSVSGIILSHEDTVWASAAAYGPGEPIVLGQGFEDAGHLAADFMDENSEAVLAELRLAKAQEADALIYGGTLRLPGRGVWAVTCEGP